MKKSDMESLLDAFGEYVDGRTLQMLISYGLIEDSFGDHAYNAKRMMERGRTSIEEMLKDEP